MKRVAQFFKGFGVKGNAVILGIHSPVFVHDKDITFGSDDGGDDLIGGVAFVIVKIVIHPVGRLETFGRRGFDRPSPLVADLVDDGAGEGALLHFPGDFRRKSIPFNGTFSIFAFVGKGAVTFHKNFHVELRGKFSGQIEVDHRQHRFEIPVFTRFDKAFGLGGNERTVDDRRAFAEAPAQIVKRGKIRLGFEFKAGDSHGMDVADKEDHIGECSTVGIEFMAQSKQIFRILFAVLIFESDIDKVNMCRSVIFIIINADIGIFGKGAQKQTVFQFRLEYPAVVSKEDGFSAVTLKGSYDSGQTA